MPVQRKATFGFREPPSSSGARVHRTFVLPGHCLPIPYNSDDKKWPRPSLRAFTLGRALLRSGWPGRDHFLLQWQKAVVTLS